MNELSEKRLCIKCVGEPFLRSEINQTGKNATCSYCDQNEKTFSIEEIADRIEIAFNEHYQRTAHEPSASEYAMLKESDHDWHREGEAVRYAICSAAAIDEDPAEDIRLLLDHRHFDVERDRMGEEGPFDPQAHYAEKRVNDIEFQIEWSEFENRFKTEARYFSRSAQKTLEEIFEGLAQHQTRKGAPVIVAAGPTTAFPNLYRARVFQSDEKLKEALLRPDLGVGPPSSITATDGRMNARGISVFYGATTPTTALAEVRPPVGSRVVVARFEIIKPIRLLEVEALRSVFIKGSIFDPDYIRRLERAKFLGSLSHRITDPVMPDDEPLEYLVTQAIADYLATEVKLDGIIYPSAQAKGSNSNIVLFHHAAFVEALEIPKDTKVHVSLEQQTEEGLEVEYQVFEELPPDVSTESNSDQVIPVADTELPRYMRLLGRNAPRKMPATLRIDVASLQVHHINGVEISAQAYSVQRHRFPDRKTHY